MDPHTSSEYLTDLLAAVTKLSNRGLVHAAKWAAETANGLQVTAGARDVVLDYEVERMTARQTMARAYFECNEYDRCVSVLDQAQDLNGDLLSTFLRLYSMYISGEKKSEEADEGVMTPRDGLAPNKEVVTILRDLDEIFETSSHAKNDPFLLYLHGVVLLKQKREDEARDRLLASVDLFPYNWSAWLELLECIPTLEVLNNTVRPRLPRPAHLISRMFLVHAHQQLFQTSAELQPMIDELDQTAFVAGFAFVRVQRALTHYHNLNYSEAESEFDSLQTQDPHRLDDMDTYSNVLYVLGKRAKLAHLAQLATATDKFRAETCCIVANYYSLKSNHEKAVLYYQRALTISRTCLTAWTLMGHEFVELKNTHAAIESYRRAVDANQRDHRAWYGLGQAYEVLEMYYYALYYYQRAAALKPFDSRLWQALGSCYDHLHQNQDAIKAYKMALRASDMDPTLLLRLALLYERDHNLDAAVSYMKQCLVDEGPNGDVTDQSCQARLWLARYELARGNFMRAHDYVESVTRAQAPYVEEARVLVLEAKTRMSTNK